MIYFKIQFPEIACRKLVKLREKKHQSSYSVIQVRLELSTMPEAGTCLFVSVYHNVSVSMLSPHLTSISVFRS